MQNHVSSFLVDLCMMKSSGLWGGGRSTNINTVHCSPRNARCLMLLLVPDDTYRVGSNVLPDALTTRCLMLLLVPDDAYWVGSIVLPDALTL